MVVIYGLVQREIKSGYFTSPKKKKKISYSFKGNDSQVEN